MKLLIGLGNPGTKYLKNRHNVGHQFIDFLASQGEALRSYFFKTDTFMNDSGRFVAEKVRFYKFTLDDLYVIHDDLDIPLGQYKIQKGVGPKVHNGINSIESSLGGKDFWRIRIGIDNRKDAIASLQHDNGADYVLSDFTEEELIGLKNVFTKIYNDKFLISN